MAVDPSTVRSRRAVLGASAAAAAGAVAASLAAALPAAAANGATVTVGGSFEGTSPTTITNANGDALVGVNEHTTAAGVYGHATSGTGVAYGVFGRSESSSGVGVGGYAPTSSVNACGVRGTSVGGSGVSGSSTTGVGVLGSSTGGDGIQGYSAIGSGVYGSSDDGAGVYGKSAGPSQAGVYGMASGVGIGVEGVATDSIFRPSPTRTGVFGYSDTDVTAVGVRGESPNGTGILAKTESGTAIDIAGRARFSRSGRATVPKNRNYVDITVPGGFGSHSVIHATIQTYRSGVAVAAARKDYPSAGKARIYLTKVASTSGNTYVGWLVAEYP